MQSNLLTAAALALSNSESADGLTESNNVASENAASILMPLMDSLQDIIPEVLLTFLPLLLYIGLNGKFMFSFQCICSLLEVIGKFFVDIEICHRPKRKTQKIEHWLLLYKIC